MIKIFGYGVAAVLAGGSILMALANNANWPVFLVVALIAFVIGKVL